MKKPKLKLPVKWITISVIIFLAFGLIMGYIWRFLKTADYFKIRDILTRADDRVDFSYLKGKNIFSVNLRNEARYILEDYPESSKIRLVRILPNRIFVDFIKRKPIGFVKLYRYFALDEEGVLFYAQNQPQNLGLPVVIGLEKKILGPRLGKPYNIKELTLALNIIKEVKRSRLFRKYIIKKIDVTNADNASIFISFPKKEAPAASLEFLEARLGEDNIRGKFAILTGLFVQEKLDLANIKYIDLRFKESVIKFKEGKN